MLRQNVPLADHTFSVSGTNSLTISGSQIFTLTNLDFNVGVMKVVDPTFGLSGSGPTLDLYLQTSDDGGVTFYDLAHVQMGTQATLGGAIFARFGALKAAPAFIGTVPSLTLGANKVSDLPLLGRTMRVVYTYASANGAQVGSSNLTVQLYLVDQDIR